MNLFQMELALRIFESIFTQAFIIVGKNLCEKNVSCETLANEKEDFGMDWNDGHVYFNQGFRPDLQEIDGQPGKPVAIEQRFQWDGQEWYIPSVYVCDDGLVIELFVRVELDTIEAFMEKWAKVDVKSLPYAEQKRCSKENPLGGRMNFLPHLYINGAESPELKIMSEAWTPFGPLNNGQSKEDVAWKEEILRQHGCALDVGWVFRRLSFVWPGGSKPQFSSATLLFDRDIETIDGPKFRVQAAGDQVTFEHPATGRSHVLTVLDYKHEEIPEENRIQMGYLLPYYYVEVEYEITPPIIDEMYGIHDCAPGDKPREVVKGTLFEKMEQCPGSGTWMKNDQIKSKQRGVDVVTSSTYFEPVDIVQWEFIFALSVCEDAVIELNFPCNEYQC